VVACRTEPLDENVSVIRLNDPQIMALIATLGFLMLGAFHFGRFKEIKTMLSPNDPGPDRTLKDCHNKLLLDVLGFAVSAVAVWLLKI
jgi:hypothetical protein